MLDTRAPAMRPAELARWAWRQLTSMRTALVLLFLLTLAALPGSLVPQRGVDPLRVQEFSQDNPTLARWYERLSLFDVYSSPWFAATYLLLFVSLIGCVLPRSRAHWTAVRARPPAAPRNLDRLPAHESWTTEATPAEVLAGARTALRDARFRVEDGDGSVAAERGHWRETGNLVFHLALLLLLVAVALGNLFGFKGSVLVVEGRAFSNTVTAYDEFSSGVGFDEGSLVPFTLGLDELAVRYQRSGEQRGAPRDFRADVTYSPAPDAPERRGVLRVNHPLTIDGTKVFLLGNGYAPVFTVRDSTGAVVFSGPVPFLPRDGNMASTGVVKVPSAQPEQLGFEGLFLPTAVLDPAQGPVSAYPDTTLPRAVLTAFTGDLGVDDGSPQSVYSLDRSGLTQVTGENGQPLAQSLAPGATMELPDGASITFDGVRRWASLQVARNPGTGPALAASVLALGGLMLSLFVRRRRVWVRAVATAEGRTLVEVAGLARAEGESRDALADEVGALAERIGLERTS
ncbi:MAG TPA: cytochrome c biogenesis protein ResB [Actinomycetes bacterium]|nr:cytochrome c biogenesis protein ResB [Actinomycetes bacterium]